MAYLALARKYRPERFADIVGQPHVVRTLANAIEMDRVHHAFLFSGARGVGKTTTARLLARALNCANGPTPEPCGGCDLCREIASGGSPDVIEIDGASNTGVDHVRELRDKVRYVPQRARYKMYIIDEVHMLSTAAFNALLKTVEEPPPHAKFVFATTEPHKIPVTVLSRCQRFDFRRVGVDALRQRLQGLLRSEGMVLDPAVVAAIAREAQGSVRDAESLLDQALSYKDDGSLLDALGVVDAHTLFALADAVFARDADRVLARAAEIDTRGLELAHVAGRLLEHFRDLMVLQATTAPEKYLPGRAPAEVSALAEQATRTTAPDLHRMFLVLTSVAEDVARSMTPQVSFEVGLLRLLEIEPTPSLRQILTHLQGASPVVAAPSPAVQAVAAPSPAVQAVAAPSPAVQAVASSSPAVQAVASSSPPVQTVASSPAASAPCATWVDTLTALRATRPALASILEHARVLSFDAHNVVLGFSADTFYWESAQAEARTLRAALAPRALTLKALSVGEAASAPASVAGAGDQARAQRATQIEEDARAHPMIRAALRILDSRLERVVVMEEQP
jgi:DNA polymerase-3 subunit gamma/tau